MVIRHVNWGTREIPSQTEVPVMHEPTESFTMEGHVNLGRSTYGSWFGDGPLFSPVDAEPITYMIDDVEHTATVATIQYEFDSMVWVPEPSTLALALVSLVGLCGCRPEKKTARAGVPVRVGPVRSMCLALYKSSP